MIDEATKLQLFRAAERSFCDHIWTLDDTTKIQDDNWFQTLTPSSKKSRLNQIRKSRIPADSVSKKIEEAINSYTSHKPEIEWLVGPLSAPRNLGEELLKAGFQERIIATIVFKKFDPLNDLPINKTAIERIDESKVNDYVEVCSAGWSTLSKDMKNMKEEMRRNTLYYIKSHADTVQYHIAYLDGIPAGGACSIIRDSILCFKGTTVDPKFRDAGIGKDLIYNRYDVCQKFGAKFLVSYATGEKSQNIFDKMGFSIIGKAGIYSYKFDQ